MKLKILLASAIVGMSMNTNIHAENGNLARLITPTLWAQVPDYFACNLTNVSYKTRKVRVRIISNGEILLKTNGFVDVEPMHTDNRFIPGLENGGPIYCEFTVEGRKGWYRGAAKLFRIPPDADNTTDSVVISAE